MRPKGKIYPIPKFSTHGEVLIQLPRIERIAYLLLRGIGIGLVTFAFLEIIFAYKPIIREELGYIFGWNPKIEYYSSDIDAEEIEKTRNEAVDLGVDPAFAIVIPKIGAAANVLANIDAGNKIEYLDALQKGVAHAKGTYFPGQGKKIYLFSHSTDSPLNIERYNAVFYLLRKLETNDKIIIFFSGKKYIYGVIEKHVVKANDASWLTTDTQSETLVLQTCDPPGTNWNRLIVIAKPVN
jgi:LPXTG-site transpeptidase (sortase) family protein